MATIRCARLDSILRIYIERIEYSIKNLRNTQQNTVNKKKKGTIFYVLSVLIECFDVHHAAIISVSK